MKKRRSSLFQRMLAVLLTAVLTAGVVSNAVPVSVLAAGGSITQDGYTWNIPDTMNITVGEEEHYGIYGGGEYLFSTNYSFSSSDSAVAIVDGGGYNDCGFDVTGVSEGTATITFICTYRLSRLSDGETKSVSGSFDVVVAPAKYTLTVNNGTGEGGYEAGAAVTITADAPASGKQFDKWVVNSGSVTLADAASSTTTFTMPAEAVELTAAYKDSVSDADKVATAKTVVENALNGFTAANATTQEEILNMINTALGNANITGVTVAIDKFRKNEATTSAAGQIDGVIFITCGQEVESMNMEKPIAKLIEGGSGGDDSGSGGGGSSGDNGGSSDSGGNNSGSSGGNDSGGDSGNDGNIGNDNGGSDGNTGNDNGGNIGSNDSGNLNGQSGGSGTATPGKAPAAVMIITPPEELENVVLTEAEKQQKAGGADIRIELDVDVVTAEADAADRALVEEALQDFAAGYTVGQYLDISLYKVIGDSRTAITETAGKITVRIDVPDSLKNTDSSRTRTFAVIRVHDGRAELLSDLDNDADTITIATDRFSTYVLVHQDMETGAENQTVRKDEEPKTGDAAPLELYATFAMIAGFTYLLLYSTERSRGMTEETKKELVSRLVGWAKRGGRIRIWIALAAVFVLLVYYHSIGKKTCAEWKQIYGE